MCIFFSTWQKLVNFFTHIRPKESRYISYNYVYLILARTENFAATLNILCLLVKYETDDYRLVFSVSISLLHKIINACQN